MNRLIKQAFTLIELLVVIAIIGILSGLIVVAMDGMTQKANIAKLQVFSNSLRNSLLLNLVSEWKFDGLTDVGQNATAEDITDSWGNNNTGVVLLGTPKIGGDCISGKCLVLSGTADYVNCGTGGKSVNVSAGESMTLEAWIKLGVSGKSQTIMAKWTPWIYFINTGSRQSFYIKIAGVDTSVASNTVVSLNTWHHVAIVYTRSDYKATFYLDGKVDGSPAFAAVIDNNSGGVVQIGGYGNINTLLSGSIDNVRIYNNAIPTSQIKEEYSSGLNSLLANGNIDTREYNLRVDSIAQE